MEVAPLAEREAVIAHSRAKYARPRLEVEREIAELNGWEMPEELMTPAEREVAQVRSRLRIVGLSADQASALIEQFELDQITRQLDWLPYRNARNPSGFLVAAVTDDYDPPAGLVVGHADSDEDTSEYAQLSDHVQGAEVADPAIVTHVAAEE
jgi:hypothetical protein